MRRAAAGALGAAVLAVVSACGGAGGGGSSNQPQHGGDLVIARTADSQSMDNTNVFDNESIWVFEQIMEPLYMVRNDGKGVEPWLATSYSMSSDQLTWTFHLRQGVKFSNGKPLTSADVKFSLDAARTVQGGWAFIDGAIDSVTAPDASAVQVHTKYPWAPLLSDLSLFSNAIVPDNYGGQSKDAFYQHPMGTGPFVWSEWNRGTTLKLTRNPHYWQRGKPYLNSVSWNPVPDDNTRSLQLRGGQAQIDEFPAWSQVQQLKSDPSVKLSLFPSTKEEYLTFIETQKPFDDIHVRRAISYAIDRKSMIKAVLFGNGSPGNSLFAPADQDYDGSAGGLQYDPAAAKREMAQSSVPHGFDTTLLVGSGNIEESSDAQVLQQALAPLGIHITLHQEDPTTAHTDCQKMTYPLCFSQWTQDIVDPDELVSFAVDPEAGAKAFFTGYDNSQVAQLSRQAERTFDVGQRRQLYSRIQHTTAAQAELAYLYYTPYPWATASKVHGFFVTPFGNYHLEDVWLSG